MARVEASQAYRLDAIDFGEALTKTAPSVDLSVTAKRLGRIELVERFRLLKLTRHASVAAVVEASGNRVLVSFVAETPGVGPIASGHSQAVLEKLMDALSKYQ
jgi:hypothetical protein